MTITPHPNHTIRIFISSPGDVADERERARRVVQSLQKRYSRDFRLEPVFWEDMPLSLDASFQQGIDYVLSKDNGIDIAIFILWSRLGSPIGPCIVREDGSQYLSGTEREFDLMLQAREAQGGKRPAILAYARQDEAAFAERLRGLSTSDKKEQINQKELLENFLLEEFHDAETGVNHRAYHTFNKPQTFAQRLRVHLQEIIDELSGHDDGAVIWELEEKGPPYRGLEAFGFEHQDIFFGREDEIVECHSRLTAAARKGHGFLLIGGPSGTGKSSLAAAGLIPDIVEHEKDETIASWLHGRTTPSQIGSSPSVGFAKLISKIVPGFNTDTEDKFREALSRDPELAVKLVLLPLLKSEKTGDARLVLLIDQLEELFSSSVFSENAIKDFANILKALVGSGYVWVIATLRSDFYPQLHNVPELLSLKNDGEQFDLAPPQVDSVSRMIEIPAQMAGVTFEKIGGLSLAERIERDVAKKTELLPLLEDLLLELFKKRNSSNILTATAYEQMGGVSGALVNRAENAFNSLDADVQKALPGVLKQLVSFATQKSDEPARRVVNPKVFSKNSSQQKLVKKLVEERLAVTGVDGNGNPIVCFAHEAILRLWPRVTSWIEENVDLLQARERLLSRMKEGSPLSKDDPLTLTTRSLLANAPDLFDRELKTYATSQIKAIDAAERKSSQRWRFIAGCLVGLTLVSFLLTGLAFWQSQLAEQSRDKAETAKVSAELAKEVATKERNLAEKLVNFLLIDMREKLVPLSQLELLQDVLEEVQEYHEARKEGQEKELSQEDLARQLILDDQMGRLSFQLGKPLDALKYYREAREICQKIQKSKLPKIDGFLLNSAHFKRWSGDCYLDQDLLNDAEELYLDVIRELLVAGETQQNFEELFEAYGGLSDLYTRQGYPKKAEVISKKQTAVVDQLIDFPGQNNLRRDVRLFKVENLRDLGRAYDELGQGQQAINKFSKAYDIMGNLRKEDPDSLEIEQKFALACLQLGTILLDYGRGQDSLQKLLLSLKSYQGLTQHDNQNSIWQSHLAKVHDTLARFYNQEEDYKQSIEHIDKSLQINDWLEQREGHDNLALIYNKAGSHLTLGQQQAMLEEFDKAQKSYELSEHFYKKVLEIDSSHMKAAQGVYYVTVCRSNLMSLAGDEQASKQLNIQALKYLIPLRERFPGKPSFCAIAAIQITEVIRQADADQNEELEALLVDAVSAVDSLLTTWSEHPLYQGSALLSSKTLCEYWKGQEEFSTALQMNERVRRAAHNLLKMNGSNTDWKDELLEANLTKSLIQIEMDRLDEAESSWKHASNFCNKEKILISDTSRFLFTRIAYSFHEKAIERRDSFGELEAIECLERAAGVADDRLLNDRHLNVLCLSIWLKEEIGRSLEEINQINSAELAFKKSVSLAETITQEDISNNDASGASFNKYSTDPLFERCAAIELLGMFYVRQEMFLEAEREALKIRSLLWQSGEKLPTIAGTETILLSTLTWMSQLARDNVQLSVPQIWVSSLADVVDVLGRDAKNSVSNGLLLNALEALMAIAENDGDKDLVKKYSKSASKIKEQIELEGRDG